MMCWSKAVRNQSAKNHGAPPFSPPSGPAHQLFQKPPAMSKFLQFLKDLLGRTGLPVLASAKTGFKGETRFTA